MIKRRATKLYCYLDGEKYCDVVTFKLTEISSQSALIPFATAPIEFESGYTAYVVSGGAVYIRLNFDKNHNLEINILMTDLVEDLNNDQEDN